MVYQKSAETKRNLITASIKKNQKEILEIHDLECKLAKDYHSTSKKLVWIKKWSLENKFNLLLIILS